MRRVPRRSAGAHPRWSATRVLLWFVATFLILQTLIGDGGLTDMRRAAQQRRELAASIAALKTENRRLFRMCRSLRDDPRAIAAVAREELGMIAPGEVLFIVRGVRRSAAPNPSFLPKDRSETGRPW